MGNLTSQHSKCCSLSLRDMDALGKNTKLNNEEIKDYFMKFQEACNGEKTISRRKFSNSASQELIRCILLYLIFKKLK